MNEELTRRMPFSLEAEQAVLGSILIDPACMDDLAVIISRDDFYMPEHAEIFTVVLPRPHTESPEVQDTTGRPV